MDIRCPACGSLIPLNGQILMGDEALCCFQCRATIHLRLDTVSTERGTPRSTVEKPSSFRIKATPQGLAELSAAPQAASSRRGTLPWVLANLGLILLLVFQYAYFQRDALAQRAALRPWLEQLCALTRCELPLQRDLRRIKVVARDLRPVPETPATPRGLRVTITILNEAPFPQPYPTLDLRFYDLEERLVAGRRFPPQIYLPPGMDLKKGLAPDTPLPIVLDLVDPGEEAVNFRFEFI